MVLSLALAVLAIVLWPVPVLARGLAPARPSVAAEHRPTTEQIAAATDLLALALRSGSPLVMALDAVAAVSPDAVAQDLRRVRAALGWGRSLREAWAYAGPGWSRTAVATVVASECGAPVADVLRECAAALRERESRRLETAAGRAGVLLVLPLGVCFLPAFIATSVVPVVVVMLARQLP